MSEKPIYVTQPNLPALDEFIPYLQEIWDKRILTNGGPFHQQLEQALCEYLGVEHIALFANGTLALVTALQSLRVTGEVITTPYSFVATAHSLLWNGIKPVFVDIDPVTLNMDPARIEAAITPQTTAIMPVHVYGYPCNVDAIQKIADNYNLDLDALLGKPLTLEGFAFGGDAGLAKVELVGEGWTVPCKLGPDEHGPYAFRRWSVTLPNGSGNLTSIGVKATNLNGLTQPDALVWNPSGYARNVIERITLRAQ